MIYYITFNDVPSGIYQSQVIDVVKYLMELKNTPVRLIAFLPLAGFKENKAKLKNQLPNAIILPIYGGITRWKLVKPLIKLFTRKKDVAIARGPLATKLALGNFRKVVYDGRAAVKAEVEEFDVTGNQQLGNDFIQAEKEAVLNADFRIAVSNKLVEYWKETFGYTKQNHVVIPCTLTSQTEELMSAERQSDEVKLVYSGGVGPWQSFDLVVKLLKQLLEKQKNVSVLFLTKETEQVNQLIASYPERCERKWLSHNEVYKELSSCDYGILIRDNKITNQVASPVKFAEYLNAGLKVLISDHLGDYTEFVNQNDCGMIVKDHVPVLTSVNVDEKKRLRLLAQDKISKESDEIKQLYLTLLDNLN